MIRKMRTPQEDESYYLSEGNFASVILDRINIFFQREKWTDVTLSTRDGVKIKAHKIYLAACSPYFLEALNGLGEDNTLFLEDVTGSQVKEILSTVYTGKVQLSANNIDALQDVAKRLCVTELENVCRKYRSQPESLSTAMDTDAASCDPLSDALGEASSNIKLEQVDPDSDNNLVAVIKDTETLWPQGERSIGGVDTVKVEPSSHNEDRLHTKYSCRICGRTYPFFSCLKLHMRKHNHSSSRERFWRTIELNKWKMYKCPMCKLQKRLKYNVFQHILHCHFKDIKCRICKRKFRSYTALQDHLYQRHNQGFRLSRNTVCLNCGRVFRHSKLASCHVPCGDNYENSIRGEHPISLKCDWCLQKFKHTKMLLRHHSFCPLQAVKNLTPTVTENVTSPSLFVHQSRSVINITPIEDTQLMGFCQDQEIDGPLRYLFDSGILGESSPKQLLETVLFMVNHFMMPLKWIRWKKGSKLFHSQIAVGEEQNGARYVAFYDGKDSGGQIFLEKSPRVKLYEKKQSRYCFVSLVSKYISLLPGVYSHGSPHGFFLTPKSTWSENSWYNQANLGIRSIGPTLKRIYRFLPQEYFVNEDWPRGNTSNYVVPSDPESSSLTGKEPPRTSKMCLMNICGFNVVRCSYLPNQRENLYLSLAPSVGATLSSIMTTNLPSSNPHPAQDNRLGLGPRQIASTHPAQGMDIKAEAEELSAIAAECARKVWKTEGDKFEHFVANSSPASSSLLENREFKATGNTTSLGRWQEFISQQRISKSEVPEYVSKINDWIKSAEKDKSRQLACDQLGIKVIDTLTDLSSAQVFFLLSYIIQTETSFILGLLDAKGARNGTSTPGMRSFKLDVIQTFYNENCRNPMDFLSDSDIKELSNRRAVNIVGNLNVLTDIQLLNKKMLGRDDPRSLAKLVCYLLSSTFKMAAEELRDLKRMAIAVDKDERGSYLCMTNDESSIFLHQRIHSSSNEEFESLVKPSQPNRVPTPSMKIYSNPEQPDLCIVNVLSKYLCKSNSWEKALILKPAKCWNNNTWYQQSMMGVSAINSLLNEVASSKLSHHSKGTLSSLQYAHMLETNLSGMAVEECHKCAPMLGKDLL